MLRKRILVLVRAELSLLKLCQATPSIDKVNIKFERKIKFASLRNCGFIPNQSLDFKSVVSRLSLDCNCFAEDIVDYVEARREAR